MIPLVIKGFQFEKITLKLISQLPEIRFLKACDISVEKNLKKKTQIFFYFEK